MERNKHYILNTILLFFVSMLFSAIIWAMLNYHRVPIEQILFHLTVPIEGTSVGAAWDFIIGGLIPGLLFFIVTLLLYKYVYTKHLDSFVVLKYKTKKITLFTFRLFSLRWTLIYCILLFLIIAYSVKFYKVDNFVSKIIQKSTFIEEHYVDPRDVEIVFPDKKQNLIYIFLESMETSYTSFEKNGSFADDLIPNLYNLSNNNISFSNNNEFGGLYQTSYTGWTIAAMVAQTSGIPLKLSIDGNTYDKRYQNFLKGTYSLGEILDKAGYNQTLMFGSDAVFAGRDVYFSQHGNYKIADYKYAKKNGNIDDDYYVFWGYEDRLLFEFAKEELLDLAKEEKPFNLTMLTVDTHAIGGYLDESCEAKYENQIESVIKCNDKMVYEFIKWIQKQDFYKDTTIVIVGDHINMDDSFIPAYADRKMYNTFINSRVTTNNTKNRIASSLDMFPTTLSALGVDIKGDRLGLGTNLFSSTETLTERYGFEAVNDELEKTSLFYPEKFIK